MSILILRQIEQSDKERIKKVWTENWGSDLMVTKGKVYNALEHMGFIAEQNGELIGLIMYRIENDECEILSLDSFKENLGVGSSLLRKLKELCKYEGVKRIWLITSNDNTNAIRFYQRRGYDLKAIYLNAVTEARRIKPEIPIIGFDNIPIKHEIELEYIIE